MKQDVVMSAIVVAVFGVLFIVLGRWWIFHKVFFLSRADDTWKVDGYRPGAGLGGKIAAFIAFPITSYHAIMRTAVGAPTAGQGNLGAGAYTFLTFLVIKPFILYSIVMPLIVIMALLAALLVGKRPAVKV